MFNSGQQFCTGFRVYWKIILPRTPYFEININSFGGSLNCNPHFHQLFIARPALAEERLSTNNQGDVIYKFKPQKKPELPLTSTEPVAGVNTEAEQEKPTSAKRMSWARLLKRVFNIDISICSRCAGKIKIIAAIEPHGHAVLTRRAAGAPKVIKKILEHLGLPWTTPRLMQARGPPQAEQSDFFAQEFFEN